MIANLVAVALCVLTLARVVEAKEVEVMSCDQCTEYSGALWCPADFSCRYYNETPHKSHRTALPAGASAAQHCSDLCGNVTCLGFLECYFGASACGGCVYLGGAWCKQTRRCYPRQLTGETMKKEFVCKENCPGAQCVADDASCAECERYLPPLRCTRNLPVVIVSCISTFLFACGLAYVIWVGYHNRGITIRGNTAIEAVSGRLLESPLVGDPKSGSFSGAMDALTPPPSLTKRGRAQGGNSAQSW